MKVLRHDDAMESPHPAQRALSSWAVLLAAGSASRMGHRPKCLIERDGVPLLVRLLQVLKAAGVEGVVLVLGHYADRIEAALSAPDTGFGLDLRRIRNPDPAAAQDASLRLGLQALPPGAEPVLVLLADQPLLEADDVRSLLAAWQQRAPGVGFLQPVHGGQPGHPVVLSAEVAGVLRTAEPGQGGRQWQAAHPEQVGRWSVDHARFTTDVDQPADLARLQAAGIALRWPADLA